jgi:hypothetical protein
MVPSNSDLSQELKFDLNMPVFKIHNCHFGGFLAGFLKLDLGWTLNQGHIKMLGSMSRVSE